MKVIDLLNKIANGEEVPHFKVGEIEYYLDWRGNLLEREEGKPSYDVRWFIDKEWLNTEVKILEEEKKIPEKLEEILEYSKYGNDISKTPDNEQLMFKINEIIDYLKSKGE